MDLKLSAFFQRPSNRHSGLLDPLLSKSSTKTAATEVANAFRTPDPIQDSPNVGPSASEAPDTSLLTRTRPEIAATDVSWALPTPAPPNVGPSASEVPSC